MNQTIERRVVDTREYIGVLRTILEEGKEVSFLVTGSSMSPFLCHGRDYVYLKKPDRKLKKGDIVFYQRKNGQYVLHRICKVTKRGFDLIGDAQKDIEHNISEDQIFAIVTKVKRKEKWIQPGDFWWTFFAVVWVRMIPLRGFIANLYGKMKRKNQTRS